MPSNRFWDREVVEAKDLIEHAKGVDYAFVGVLRAKAIVEVDEELKKLRQQIAPVKVIQHVDLTAVSALPTGSIGIAGRFYSEQPPSESDSSHRDGPPHLESE